MSPERYEHFWWGNRKGLVAQLQRSLEQLEQQSSTADVYATLDEIEKAVKGAKSDVRREVLESKNYAGGQLACLYGNLYAVQILRKPGHASVKYAALVTALQPFVHSVDFEKAKAAHTTLSERIELRVQKVA